MEALATRLSNLDSHVEGAIRIVMFYDTLMRRRVDLPALARASAGLAECVAGIRLHSTGQVIRMSPGGTPADGEAAVSSRSPILLDDEEIGEVWLERDVAGPLDEVVLDRLAIAAAAVVERYGPARTTMADPALVELVVSADSDEAGRARALRLLGFAPGQRVHVVAVSSELALDRVAAVVCPGHLVKAAQVAGPPHPAKAAPAVGAAAAPPHPASGVGVLLATRLGDFPPAVRAGIGTDPHPARAWSEARTALRFTTARTPVVHHPDLGALALLAHVPTETLRANADVTAVATLSAEDLDTLDAYCATGSLRRAADLLHLHHSSVSRRLEQIGKVLDVTDLARAKLALAAFRLL
ncbi:helix-turn-helix domain-containing protein [Lentzea aerocolonigenes]|uniref:helix-turn-helix domain-containing protein n=1 Tax=Lentzea aerocolonigenes TaxID=68170 RepID=UPI0004C369FA|nr:helix-turn-helix domain-containing protein [Lentzea aerocolonigenes]MCP2242535.1 PucR C-terminal helix-turn-helix domain-containing protein [Lentzea aerocolonigenes]